MRIVEMSSRVRERSSTVLEYVRAVKVLFCTLFLDISNTYIRTVGENRIYRYQRSYVRTHDSIFEPHKCRYQVRTHSTVQYSTVQLYLTFVEK